MSKTLAINGGRPARTNILSQFNTIGYQELDAVGSLFSTRHDGDPFARFGMPLSGYLGGNTHGGVYVQRLEELWSSRVGVKHSIATNSATSGLLAACAVTNKKYTTTTPYTMSATAAAPYFCGSNLVFGDIEPDYFCLQELPQFHEQSALIATNLFGHPASLGRMRRLCDDAGAVLIEDNAQSPFAMENGKYAGTIGHIGVFSLNYHKHISCGEGGIICTNDDNLAYNLRLFINHGEAANTASFSGVGLNLRMTELTAAIAITQLARADEIMANRVHQAEALTAVAEKFEWLTPPKVRDGCSHSYYVWAFKFDHKELGISREQFIRAMEAEGFPLVNGYVAPLYHLPAFSKYARSCPVADRMHDTDLGYFENCGWSLTAEQIQQFGEALKKIEDNIGILRKAA